jgi:hypothetical protein
MDNRIETIKAEIETLVAGRTDEEIAREDIGAWYYICKYRSLVGFHESFGF